MNGFDPALLTRRIADGLVVVEGPRELIDVAKADIALQDALGAPGRRVPAKKGSTAARPGSGRRSTATALAGTTLHEARTIKACEDAQRAKKSREREALELAQMRGELIEIAEAARMVSDEYVAVRAKLLSLPSKLAAPLAVESTVSGCRALLVQSIHEALRELTADAGANQPPTEASDA